MRACFVAAGLAGLPAPHGTAATLVVSNTSASGPGSLQQAILDANATMGSIRLFFKSRARGAHHQPTNTLPPITDSVVIDGTTQPGFAGTPLIQLNGSNAGSNDGLRLHAGNSTIRGLAINRFGGAGIHVLGPRRNQHYPGLTSSARTPPAPSPEGMA